MKRTRPPTAMGIKIKVAMLQQNMEIKELARRIDRSESTVCDIISGKNKSEKTRGLIMRELGMELDTEHGGGQKTPKW